MLAEQSDYSDYSVTASVSGPCRVASRYNRFANMSRRPPAIRREHQATGRAQPATAD